MSKLEVCEDGKKQFYDKNGSFHKEDGPAIEYPDGSKLYFQHGKLHREDGPAEEWINGTKVYHVKGACHRLDGPAVVWADGKEEYWINDEQLSEKEFLNKTKDIKTK